MFAVRDTESALDIVQDAMLKLAEKYGDRPAGELPLVFQRILQNAIRDFFRRSKVRSLWTTLLGSIGAGRDGEDDYDPLETLQVDPQSEHYAQPPAQLERSQLLEILEQEICRLVNAKPSSCVTGRNWMLRRPPESWAARRVA